MNVRPHPDLPDMEAVVAAFRRLEPDTEADWGRMDAPQMVEHLRRFNEIYLGRRPSPLLVRLLGRVLGGFFIKKLVTSSPFEMRHNMGTMPQIKMQPGSAPETPFEANVEKLLETFHEIDRISGTWDHPLYGSIDAEVGKALVRHHATHHLHQFGLAEAGGAGPPHQA